MAPAFARAAQQLEPGIRLVKVNIDEEPALPQRFGVSSIPTMILVSHGREIDRIIGARSEADLVNWASQRRRAAAEGIGYVSQLFECTQGWPPI